MKEITKQNGIKLNLDNVKVQELYVNEFDGQTRTSVHLSQDRVTIYPSQRMDTGFGDGLFDNPDGNEYETTRNTILTVPNGSSKESVEEQVKKFTDACIYRKVTNNLDEVISSREKQAIENGFTTKEALKPRYVVRDSEGNVYANHTHDGEVLKEDDRVIGKVVETEDGKSLEITNPNAVLEFKRDIFSREYQEDIDNRVTVAVAEKETKEELVS